MLALRNFHLYSCLNESIKSSFKTTIQSRHYDRKTECKSVQEQTINLFVCTARGRSNGNSSLFFRRRHIDRGGLAWHSTHCSWYKNSHYITTCRVHCVQWLYEHKLPCAKGFPRNTSLLIFCGYTDFYFHKTIHCDLAKVTETEV